MDRRRFLKSMAAGVGAAMLSANIALAQIPSSSAPYVSQARVCEWLKAATARAAPAPGTKAESLEHTLKDVTFRLDHLNLYRVDDDKRSEVNEQLGQLLEFPRPTWRSKLWRRLWRA
jgi:hypothetical protein